MASLKMNIPHQLSQEEAITRIKGLLGQLKQEQQNRISGVQENWNGDTANFQFTAQGFDLSGLIHVGLSNVVIDAELPFALSLFKGKIKQVISDKASEILAKDQASK